MHKSPSSMALFAGVVAAFAACTAFAQEVQHAPNTVPAQTTAPMPAQAQDHATTGMRHASEAGMTADAARAKAAEAAAANTDVNANADADADAKNVTSTKDAGTPKDDPRR